MQDWISNSRSRNLQVVIEQDALERKYWSPASQPAQAA